MGTLVAGVGLTASVPTDSTSVQLAGNAESAGLVEVADFDFEFDAGDPGGG